MEVSPPETVLPASRPIRRWATRLDDRAVRDIAEATEPVVFTGGIEHWPARQRWTFGWLRGAHGDAIVPVEQPRYHRRGNGAVVRVGRREHMALRDYLDLLEHDDERLDGGCLIGRELLALVPALRDDVRFPEVQLGERLAERQLFVGPSGAFDQLCHDRALGLHAMIAGRRRWQLYAPDLTARLRPVQARPGSPWSVMSEHDLGPIGGRPAQLPGGVLPDHDVVLEAGDVLYVPYGWWHRVETLAPSITTSFRWWSWPVLMRHGPRLAGALARRAVVSRLRTNPA